MDPVPSCVPPTLGRLGQFALRQPIRLNDRARQHVATDEWDYLMKKTMAAAAAVSMLVFTAACGGGGRPSVDEIADAIKKDDTFSSADATDKQVDCVAKAYHDSDISDEALQALVDGDEDYDASKEDEKAAESALKDLSECLS